MDSFTESIPLIIKTEPQSSDCADEQTTTERLPTIVKIESLALSAQFDEYTTSTENVDRVPLNIKAEPSSDDYAEVKTAPPTSDNHEYCNDRVIRNPARAQLPYDIRIKRIHSIDVPRPGFNFQYAEKRLKRKTFTNPKYLPKQIVIKHIESRHWNFFKLLQHCKPNIEELLTHALLVDGQLEYNLYMNLSFNVRKQFVFSSKFIILTHPSEIDVTIEVLMELLKLEISLHEEPFWFSKEIQIHELIVNTRKRPKRCGGYLIIPMDVCNLEVVLNIHNNDDFCFKWAIVCATRNQSYWDVHDKVDINSDYIRFSGQVLDFSGLQFPLEVRECQIFERNNHHISVNVFGLDSLDGGSSKINGPLYRTRKEKKLHVNLLYIEDSRRNKSHYAWIRQLRQLLHKFGFPPSKYMCNTCLRHFLVARNFFRHKSKNRNCEKPLSINP